MNILILALFALTLSPRQRRAFALSLDGCETDDDLVSSSSSVGQHPPLGGDQPAPQACNGGAGWGVLKEVA